MPINEEECIAEIADYLVNQMFSRESSDTLAEELFRGAINALELSDDFEDWFEHRFKKQFVILSHDDYSKALTRALWLAPGFAPTDFGGGRQRDMGQVWTDTARGFLGEIALSRFLEQEYGIQVKADTSRGGELEDYLTTDIKWVKFPDEEWRDTNFWISTKTTKFNGRWLDLPGAQYEHSDVYILAKIGILRQHFLAFLKAISFMRDKLFARARDLGELTEETSRQLWDEIPEFEPIPAYIPGFLIKDELTLPIHAISARTRGRTHVRITISQGIGYFSREALRANNTIQSLDPIGNLPIEIEPIIKSLTGAHFLAHSGGLKYKEEDWLGLISGM